MALGTLRPLDLVVLLGYFASSVAVGLWVSHHRRTSDDFMAAGRRVPGWAVGLSIYGTYVSSISFLALPSKAYASDWNPFAFSLSIPLTTWIAVRYFVPFYRQTTSVSSYEHLERRFGPWARTYAVACYLLTQVARMGTITYLLALAVAPLTGWSVPALIIITGAIVALYTWYGGMEAVIWTDVVQSLVFMAGAGACVVVLAVGVPEGPGQLMRVAVEADKFSLGSFGSSVGTSTFWVVLVYGLFINLQNFGIDQSYVQRYQTASSDAEARRSLWLGAYLYLPTSAVFLLIGTGLYSYYQAQPGLLPAEIATAPDSVFPYFIAHQLPAGLAGLVVAAVFAAAQSTLSGSVTGAATLLLCDVYQRYVRPHSTDAHNLRVLRGATLLMSVTGTGMALAMISVKSALDAWWQLASIFSGGMLGLFLLGLISRRARSGHAAVGVALGVLVIVWMTFSPAWPDRLAAWRSPFHTNLVVVIGTLAIFLVGLLVASRSRAAAGSPQSVND